MPQNRAIFLDRDGTLNYDCGYTYRLQDLRLLENVVEGLQLFRRMGFLLIIATNQSGIARGYYREEEMHAFNAFLAKTLRAEGVTLDGIYYSPFHPKLGVGEYRRESICRKPGPGMLFRAARDHDIDLARSYVVGDKVSDVQAGRAAGCQTILVRTGCAGGDGCGGVRPDWVADHVFAAARLVEAVETGASAQPAGASLSSR